MEKIKVDVNLLKRLLTVDDALELLKPHKEGRKQRVHTLIATSYALMGCDMDLTKLKKELKAAAKIDAENIQIAGINMNRMNHGVAFWTEHNGWMFLETNKEKLEKLLKYRRINLEKL